MNFTTLLRTGLTAAVLSLALSVTAIAAPAKEKGTAKGDDTYTAQEIAQKGADFFGVTTEAMAKAIEKVFSQNGRPNAYIAGSEGSGAIGVGLRYGEGKMFRKNQSDVTVYWQGPSIGFDIGANASKVFTLVYNLPNTDAIFQRFPGVDGSYYLVAGIGVNYQQNGRVILAPMRTGVGLRAGVNAGYLSYTRERNILPF